MTDPAGGTDLAPLDELVHDARQLPLSLLPRPRRQSPVVDLTEHDIVVPDTVSALIADYEPYGV